MCHPYIESAIALPDYDKSQETTLFSGHQKLTSAMKLRPEKLWQTSNLLEPPEVRLVSYLEVYIGGWC